MDARITELAERQHGVVGRRQLLARGLPEKHLDALLRSGRVAAVTRGVYRVVGAPPSPLGELHAALLRCGPSARVAGPRLLGLVGVSVHAGAPFVVLTRPGRRVRGVAWEHRTNPCEVDDDAATVAGLSSVTPARSLLEAAVDLEIAALRELVDRCRVDDGRILSRAARLAERRAEHPGARRLLEDGLVDGAAPESAPEREMGVVLAGLGGEPQVWVTPEHRVDLFFRDARLVVEYDGRGTHGKPQARTADSARDAALRALGFAVLRVTAERLADAAGLRRDVEGLLAALPGGG